MMCILVLVMTMGCACHGAPLNTTNVVCSVYEGYISVFSLQQELAGDNQFNMSSPLNLTEISPQSANSTSNQIDTGVSCLKLFNNEDVQLLGDSSEVTFEFDGLDSSLVIVVGLYRSYVEEPELSCKGFIDFLLCNDMIGSNTGSDQTVKDPAVDYQGNGTNSTDYGNNISNPSDWTNWTDFGNFSGPENYSDSENYSDWSNFTTFENDTTFDNFSDYSNYSKDPIWNSTDPLLNETTPIWNETDFYNDSVLFNSTDSGYNSTGDEDFLNGTQPVDISDFLNETESSNSTTPIYEDSLPPIPESNEDQKNEGGSRESSPLSSSFTNIQFDILLFIGCAIILILSVILCYLCKLSKKRPSPEIIERPTFSSQSRIKISQNIETQNGHAVQVDCDMV